MEAANTEHDVMLGHVSTGQMVVSPTCMSLSPSDTAPVERYSFGCNAAPAHLWWACGAVLYPSLNTHTRMGTNAKLVRAVQDAENMSTAERTLSSVDGTTGEDGIGSGYCSTLLKDGCLLTQLDLHTHAHKPR